MRFAHTTLLALVLWTTPSHAQQQQQDVYDGCDLETYYADLLAISSDPLDWPVDQIRELLTSTHRNRLPTFPTAENPDDWVAALIDLWPAADSTPTLPTIQLLYRQTSIAARPALGLENWRPEHYWPTSRGPPLGSFQYTDVHQLAPADYSVLDDKDSLNRQFQVFFGKCGTVQDAAACVAPANTETPADTAQDGKIYTPPAVVRGDIARGLFYDALRYVEATLTDCPPFGPYEYGYRSALLEWHAADGPDEAEQARNDRACRQWQGNRNVFVDYPQLVAQVFGEPDFILPNQQLYSQCTAATEAPTATPNDCSAIGPGDIAVFGFNSVNPDQLLFYPIDNIPESVENLYLTTKAWDGRRLLDSTGTTIRYPIPAEGIDAGVVFAYNAVVKDYSTGLDRPDFVWLPEEGNAADTTLDLDANGDHLHLYCINADGQEHFIFSLAFKQTAWMAADLTTQQYTANRSSALPERLQGDIGSVILPQYSNWFYNGTQEARANVLLPAFADANQWIGSDAAFAIDSRARTSRFVGGLLLLLTMSSLLVWWL